MHQWVEITFDCLPLRSVARLDVPLDASPKLSEKILRIKAALEKNGTHNTYYLHNSKCIFHLTNDALLGMIDFRFEGTLFTDSSDLKTQRTELIVTLEKENCDWLNQSVVNWLAETVKHAVMVEFDRYISAGDLQRTRDRLEKIEKSIDDQQGYVGMYL